MKQFFQTLPALTFTQATALVVLISPIVGVIWAIFKWAYDTRLKNLESTLSDFRSDFARRVTREKESLEGQYQSQYKDQLKEFSKTLAGKNATFEQLMKEYSDLMQALHDLYDATERVLKDSLSQFDQVLTNTDEVEITKFDSYEKLDQIREQIYENYVMPNREKIQRRRLREAYRKRINYAEGELT